MLQLSRAVRGEGLTPMFFAMMRAILFVILILWMVGVATSYTLGGLIHLLLLLAAIVLFIDLIDRRKWL